MKTWEDHRERTSTSRSNTGFTVSPGLVANQMTGAAIMGLSRALYEQLTFTKERITSLDWVTYPILQVR